MSIEEFDMEQNRILKKGKEMSWIGVIAVFLGVLSPLSAEMRTWVDATGVRFEGAYSKELLGGVVIKDLKGKSHHIRTEQLSKADLDYIEHHIPPEIEAKVSFKTHMLPRTAWVRVGDNTTIYTFTVAVEKTSNFAYKDKLCFELFVVANERSVNSDRRLVLMHREKMKFIFPEEKNGRCEFSVPEISINAYRADWIEPSSRTSRGKDYAGYILAVSDLAGRIIFCDTDISGVDWLTKDLPSSVEKLRELYINHPGSIDSRHFNDSFKKITPPSIRWFQRTTHT
jgi:hypothetical protein